MTFSISAGGNAEETLAILRGYTDDKLGSDPAAPKVRDLIIDLIDNSPDLEDHQVYMISAYGSTGPEVGFTLGLTVQLGDRHVPDGQRHDPELGHAVAK